MTSRDRSAELFRRARRSLVGGVDSPVRSFAAVGGVPRFIASGRGAWLTDVDGRRYVDLVGSWGANILGGAPRAVVEAVARTSRGGLSFGAPSPLEHELAERIRRAAPEIDRLRFVCSGTEAVMAAVRVARGFTGRELVVKFEGGYHGHSDGLLAKAGSGLATAARPDSAGVPRGVAAATRVVPYNDPEALAELFERSGERIAAVLVEPVAGNMGVVPAERAFLSEIAKRCRHNGSLVIADEVITGFRLRRGLVAPSLGLAPDLVALGKVIGGGLPIGAYGGRRAVMETVAPLGPVYQAGTLAGTPVAMAAGAAVLDAVDDRSYARLERSGAAIGEALLAGAERARLRPFSLGRVGSMFTPFFAPGPVRDLEGARASDARRYARFFHRSLDRGLYLPPSRLESAFSSLAIGPRELARVRTVVDRALADVRGSGG